MNHTVVPVTIAFKGRMIHICFFMKENKLQHFQFLSGAEIEDSESVNDLGFESTYVINFSIHLERQTCASSSAA